MLSGSEAKRGRRHSTVQPLGSADDLVFVARQRWSNLQSIIGILLTVNSRLANYIFFENRQSAVGRVSFDGPANFFYYSINFTVTSNSK